MFGLEKLKEKIMEKTEKNKWKNKPFLSIVKDLEELAKQSNDITKVMNYLENSTLNSLQHHYKKEIINATCVVNCDINNSLAEIYKKQIAVDKKILAVAEDLLENRNNTLEM